jgi:hypothetical protein
VSRRLRSFTEVEAQRQRCGVAPRVGVDLDRDVALAGFRPLPDRSEQVAGCGDIAHRQLEEDALGVAVRGRDLLVVGVAAREGLGEDGRVRGDADDGVVFDHFAYLVWGNGQVAATVAVALFASTAAATVVAMGLPYALNRLGRDPAFGAGSVATVIQDLLSIVIYFAVAVALAP